MLSFASIMVDLDPILKGIPSSIWELSMRYQDKRQDSGHAYTVTQYGVKLLESYPKADPEVVIPACILHDIGWSQITYQEKMDIDRVLTPQQSEKIRHNHQIEGVRLAINILNSVNYDPEKTAKILEIILGHDTRKGTISLNDSIMRDADKLWRFSAQGMQLDVSRAVTQDKSNYAYWLNLRAEEIEQKGYFFTTKAKEIAQEELEKRKGELGFV